jgi:hypothetical protein
MTGVQKYGWKEYGNYMGWLGGAPAGGASVDFVFRRTAMPGGNALPVALIVVFSAAGVLSRPLCWRGRFRGCRALDSESIHSGGAASRVAVFGVCLARGSSASVGATIAEIVCGSVSRRSCS